MKITGASGGAGRLLAIDPGVHRLAYALFEHEHLIHCGLLNLGDAPASMVAAIVNLTRNLQAKSYVIEVPQVYQAKRQATDANDLIDLAQVVGVCVAAAIGRDYTASIRQPRPHEWKSNVPKDIQNKRDLARLDLAEIEVYKHGINGIRKSWQHNVIDAVGIGLWALNRGK